MTHRLDLKIPSTLSDDQIDLLIEILDEIIAFLSRIALYLDRYRRPTADRWRIPDWMSDDHPGQ